jgi:fatty acid desaturase
MREITSEMTSEMTSEISVQYDMPAHRAKAFVAELDRLRERIDAETGTADLRHIRRISLVGRCLSIVGYALCAIGLTPLSVLCAVLFISLGRFTRWVIVAHTVLHKAYDKLDGASPAWHSRSFARGKRRFIDWLDWLQADDWHAQHNVLHHCHVGHEGDPDRLAVNMSPLKQRSRWIRALVLLATGMTWKWSYYGPSTRRAGHERRTGRSRLPPAGSRDGQPSRTGPGSLLDRELLLRSYLPYALVHFVLIPCAFLPLGTELAVAALVSSLLAEVLVNLHSFAVVAPTHTGLDVPIFHGKAAGRHEYFIRQVVGTTNYRCGTAISDFLQGYMGYQIEHHLWPDLPILQYRRVQAEVEALCGKYGLPYRKHSVWRRIFEMVRAVVSDRHVTAAQIEISPEGTRPVDERRPAGRTRAGAPPRNDLAAVVGYRPEQERANDRFDNA